MAKMEIEISDEAQAMWDLMVVGGANPQLNPTITYTAKDEFPNSSGAFGDTIDDAIKNAFENWKNNGKD